jgi:hypothetical protein
MEPIDDIERGKAAWQRLQARETATYDDWVAVGRALVASRAIAMAEAKCNAPVGGAYNEAYGRLLREAGLASVDAPERYKIIKVVENLAEVSRWRESLSPAERRRCNHPSTLWIGWRRATKAAKPAPRREPIQGAKSAKPFRRTSRPSGDLIKLVATALHEANTRDYYIQAEAVLNALYDAGLLDTTNPPPLIKRPAADAVLMPAQGEHNMTHSFARKAGHGAAQRRVGNILKSRGGCAGSDQSPFSSAHSGSKGGKSGGGKVTRGKAAEREMDMHAEGGRSPKRFARGGKVKKPAHTTNVVVVAGHHPMGGAPGKGGPGAGPMAGPPGMSPPGGGPPPGMGPPMGGPPGLPPGLPMPRARGGRTLPDAGALSGEGRFQKAMRKG